MARTVEEIEAELEGVNAHARELHTVLCRMRGGAIAEAFPADWRDTVSDCAILALGNAEDSFSGNYGNSIKDICGWRITVNVERIIEEDDEDEGDDEDDGDDE